MRGLMLMGALLVAGCGGPLNEDTTEATASRESALDGPKAPPAPDPCAVECKDVTDPVAHTRCYVKCLRANLPR